MKMAHALALSASKMTDLALTRRVDALRSVTAAAFTDKPMARALVTQRRVYRLELQRRDAAWRATRRYVTHETAPVGGVLQTVALSTPIAVF